VLLLLLAGRADYLRGVGAYRRDRHRRRRDAGAAPSPIARQRTPAARVKTGVTARTAPASGSEGLEVGGTVDEALRGRLEEVRATLAEILERRQLVSGREEPAPSAE
jgi:hypothetical protein